MLVLIATPIGNLKDLSQRAIEELSSANLVLCEDTRHSKILLDHYQITTPLLSYQKFNEKKRLEEIFTRLEMGEKIALISDAGTPCLCDPGQILVKACIEKKIPFTAIPGPCSFIVALLLSGFIFDRFQFVGFLEKNDSKMIQKYLHFPGVTVAFESPYRLLHTLKEIDLLDPHRQVAVAREMTKKFEECRRGVPKELIAHFEKEPVKGEIVLCISENRDFIDPIDPMECIEMLISLHGFSVKEAIREAAQLLQKNRKELYQKFHHIEKKIKDQT